MQRLKNRTLKYILCLFLLIEFFSCQTKCEKKLKVFLPENFRGYGAVIFNSRNDCLNNYEIINISIDSNKLGYIENKECFKNGDIQNCYLFYIKKDNKYVKVEHLLNNDEKDVHQKTKYERIVINGGELTGYNNYVILLFHVSTYENAAQPLIQGSKEEREIRFKIENFIKTELENYR